jgi:hypothetical protein
MKIVSLVGIVLCGVMFAGCASLEDPVAGDISRRANLNGTITTGPMLKMPPLAQRGVRKVALVLDIKPVVSFHFIGLTVFQNKYYDSQGTAVFTEKEIRELFLQRWREQSAIEVVDFSEEKQAFLPHLKISKWDATGTFVADPGLDAKITEMLAAGIDAILVITEKELYDYVGHSNQQIGPKGLYQRFSMLSVYGGFGVRLMDLKTKAEMKHAAYDQASARSPAALQWKSSMAEFTSAEIRILAEELKAVYRTNVDEALLMLKATKDAR